MTVLSLSCDTWDLLLQCAGSSLQCKGLWDLSSPNRDCICVPCVQKVKVKISSPI